MNILDHEIITELFRNNYLFFVLGLMLGVFAFTFYVMPKVLWVSQEKNLVKDVNLRSSHSKSIPNFGGVAFFLVLVLVISILQSVQKGYAGNHLIAAMTMLFLVGLKDDLVISTARVKLLGQVMAACFIIFSPEMHLYSLHGFLGVEEVPEILSYGLKGLFIVALINAYNLIDGIDGLAAIIGIVVSSCYAVVFYETGHPYFVLLSVTVLATLAAYLRFNFSRGRRKMFMGDCGSLIIGLMLAFLSLKMLVMEAGINTEINAFNIRNRIPFLLVILILPILDTLRVMIIRMSKGRNPFEADKNHIHHLLLDCGFNHWQTSLFLGIINIGLVLCFIFLGDYLSNLQLLLLSLGFYLLGAIMLEITRRNLLNIKFREKYA